MHDFSRDESSQECASFDTPSWYLARTAGFLEKHAYRELSRNNVTALLPLERKDNKVVPVFPRYIFVRFNLRKDAWRKTLAVRGISSYVSFNPEGLPEAVDDRLIATLTARLDATGLWIEKDPEPESKKQVEQAYMAGEQLRVLSGPFSRFIGVCDMQTGDRVMLLLSIFGRGSIVEMPASEVERVTHGGRAK